MDQYPKLFYNLVDQYIHQEQEILIHQIIKEWGTDPPLRIGHFAEGGVFSRTLLQRVPINFFPMVPNFKSDHLSFTLLPYFFQFPKFTVRKFLSKTWQCLVHALSLYRSKLILDCPNYFGLVQWRMAFTNYFVDINNIFWKKVISFILMKMRRNWKYFLRFIHLFISYIDVCL